MSEDKPFGRPTKYREEFCEIVIELGKQGFTQDRMAAYLHISVDSFQEYRNKHKDFSAAVSMARTYSSALFTEKVEGFITDKEVNSQVLSLFAMNAHNWHKKEKIEEKSDVNMTIGWKKAEE